MNTLESRVFSEDQDLTLLPVPRWVRYTSVSRYTTLPFFKCTNRICRKRTHYDRANAFGREFEISIRSHKVACCMAMALSCVCAHIASGVQLMHVLSEHGSVNYDDSLSIVVSNM